MKDLTSGGQVGCTKTSGAPSCTSASALTDDDFTYDGVEYQLNRIINIPSSGLLALHFDKTLPAALRSALTLNVGSTQLALADATQTASDAHAQWDTTGLSWSVGDTVSLSLTEGSTPNPPTQHNTTHWSDTLTAKAVDYGYGCGYRSGQPQCDDQLTNDVITYDGVDYEVELVHVAYAGGTLQLILDREPRDRDGSITERSRLVLRVGPAGSARDFRVADATVSYGIADQGEWTNTNAWVLSWTGTGLVWNENDAISLSLVTPPVGGL